MTVTGKVHYSVKTNEQNKCSLWTSFIFLLNVFYRSDLPKAFNTINSFVPI